MRILSLEVSNILSIENASLSFEEKGLVLVEGWNHDTCRANGAGKTAIFNCLSFALFEKIPRKITASEILRRGTKTGYAKCSVQCGEDTWTVIRHRPKDVKFYKNDTQQDISQQEFESIIRFNYEQFLLTIYTPQANAGYGSRFIGCSDTDKKQFLLQLLNLEKFNVLKKAVDEKVKSLCLKIDDLNMKSTSHLSKIEAYNESIIDVDELKKIISKNQINLSKVDKEILELSKISRPDLSKFQKIEDDLSVKQAKISKAELQKTLLMSSYREIKSAITGYNPNEKCTECGSSLDNEEARIKHVEHQDKLNKKLALIKSQIDECDDVISKKTSILDLSKKIKDKKTLETKEYDSAVSRISELKAFKAKISSQLETLNEKLESNQELRNKIVELEESVNQINSNIYKHKVDLELYKTLSNVYSPTGAQAYVLDSVIDSFNELVKEYIDILWPNASYVLNSYKETSKGETIAKFSESLTLDGTEVSVGSLSGGELKGLSLCIDFALLDVLQTQFGLTLNPVVLDEPFDGLDTIGRELVISLLEKLAQNRQIFVIDHASEAKTLFTRIILVNKRNGVSSITIET